MVLKTVEHKFDVDIMLFLSSRENKYVIKVNHTKDIQVVVKNIQYKRLECCRSVSETIRDNEMFKEPKVSAKSCFPLITLSDAKVTVSRFEINNGENFATLNTVKEVVSERNRKSVFLCDSIEAVKINTKSNVASFLASKENGSSSRGGGALNVTTLEVGCDIFSNSISLSGSKSINWTERR